MDGCKAIITSGNFTRGGLVQNYEYGIALYDKSLVESISDDMRAYAGLGSTLTLETLGRLADETRELQTLKKNAERAQRQTGIGKQLRQRANVIQDTLLRSRIRDRPITAIFSDTIRYLLWSGPKTTEELHERKDIHPDICDDTIDRVINGQRFGKLWKHLPSVGHHMPSRDFMPLLMHVDSSLQSAFTYEKNALDWLDGTMATLAKIVVVA